MRRRINLDDYDFRPVPGMGDIVPADSSQAKLPAPLAVDEAEEIDYEFHESNDPFILEDREDDSWGGSIITLDDIEEAQRAGVMPPEMSGFFQDLGGKISSAAKRVGGRISSSAKAVGGRIAASAKETGSKISESWKETFDPAKFPWTQENREEGTRRAMDEVMKPTWDSLVNGDKSNPSVLEIYRRIKSLLESVATNQQPQFVAGPPVVSANPAQDFVAATQQVASLGWLQYALAAFTTANGLIDAGYQERAAKLLKGLDMDAAQTDIEAAVKAFQDAGGQMPPVDTPPPQEFIDQFITEVKDASAGVPRVTGDDNKNPKEGWYFHYVKSLVNQLRDYKAPLEQARAAMATALKAYQKNEMPQALQSIGRIVTELFNNRVISPTEVNDAVSVLHKVKQGYALTPEEQVLFNRISPAITGSKFKKVAAGVGVAAALTALLTQF